MAKLFLVPALAVGIGAIYYIAKHRHHDEVPEDKPATVPDFTGGGTLMEEGIE
jgi:hypothetical protein